MQQNNRRRSSLFVLFRPRLLIGPPDLVFPDVTAKESHLAPAAAAAVPVREQVDRPAHRHADSGTLNRSLTHRPTGGNMAEAKPKTSPKAIKFLFGGLAGMGATVFVQPLDLVKNRMQLSGQGTKAREYKTSFHALFSILKNEGVGGIYTGLSAGLLRQATYTTTRLGIYTILFEKMTGEDGRPPNFFLKALIGMTAGATGAFVGTPAEVALIRMTADGRLPPDQRRGYSNVFNALARITREEGVATLWRGCVPTMARAVVVNAAQLASYSQSKQALLDSGYFGDDILCHFCASMISGLVTTAASMPVDIVKTRIQNMRMIDGKPEYKNGLEVLFRVVGSEGFFSLWKGFTPYYARLGPHTVLTFIFLEQMNRLYKTYVLDR
ncbi:mitochondrial 2-oxoglutarate/malate carrier protein [Acanthochromis polyacanthus]|uniref:mitochondrial 2-oxoglutarate/malate carrier protein n=1 Tax=Acanthochromis polyacanthus TaxID=80966 RepID=UPI0022344404|nr:mitochondrial 2-oxoglutarate/malate carrier protein [Acanthochromis polyacanthus]